MIVYRWIPHLVVMTQGLPLDCVDFPVDLEEGWKGEEEVVSETWKEVCCVIMSEWVGDATWRDMIPSYEWLTLEQMIQISRTPPP